MTRENFLSILESQHKSGLSIKSFCRNEAYYPATFYYWKKKFCSFDSNTSPARANDHAEDFAPVRFSSPKRPSTKSAAEDLSKELNEIMIELPTGIKIHFRGACESEVAMRLITQMYSGHVLSQ